MARPEKPVALAFLLQAVIHPLEDADDVAGACIHLLAQRAHGVCAVVEVVLLSAGARRCAGSRADRELAALAVDALLRTRLQDTNGAVDRARPRRVRRVL